MPIYSNYFAFYHDQPISASFLDRWRGYEQLNKEAVTIEEREVSYDLQIPLYLSIQELQADIHIPGILVVGVSALVRAAIATKSADPQQIQAILLVKTSYDLGSPQRVIYQRHS